MDKFIQDDQNGNNQAAEDRIESESTVAGAAIRRGPHPSRSLQARARGFGVAAGYERPYRQRKTAPSKGRKAMYGTLPHAGYYGIGTGARPFSAGQAGFADELTWYGPQYGEDTRGQGKA
jgi:hypothetical protein